MNQPEPISDELKELIDGYLSGLLSEARLAELDERLHRDPEARRYYVRYARLHTDLHLEAHARQATARALDQIASQTASPPTLPGPTVRGRLARGLFSRRALVAAACLLLAAGVAGWLAGVSLFPTPAAGDQAIASLINAQNCTWAAGEGPEGPLLSGKVLKIESGLAELHFGCGARVILQGPARLELLSPRSARLLSGKLTARVPPRTTGFELLSPGGKVIDLGTEFGLAVTADGTTEVVVFQGKVEAFPGAGDKGVQLTTNQAARIEPDKVVIQPAAPDQFVRAIVPPPAIVPRTLRLTFDRTLGGGLRDGDGRGTGLTHRLPGTGGRLPDQDPNLRLDTEKARLELTATVSDINTQWQLQRGEYPGVRLSDLGFTGGEDFGVTATFPDIPALGLVGQFGLYAGTARNKNIRGGLLNLWPNEPNKYTQFLVNNHGGPKSGDSDLGKVGLLSTGTDLRFKLARTGGKYALKVENLTDGSTSTLTIRHPEFLDGERELYVGIFGAIPRGSDQQGGVVRPLIVKDFEVTVWTVSPAGSRPAAED